MEQPYVVVLACIERPLGGHRGWVSPGAARGAGTAFRTSEWAVKRWM
ncbi:hypothetical protein IDM40_21155 [Nocardiopsis sp. HNM0947]|uniref:Uncharacterized protein n=1 Tax=Nocardiopsis coralli TaxID=2772213 RepID=A0ABR9PBF7_9ACTN|nr:hypothetical protein [Nocardiopsis coralli]MBE3001181.1 hypothetical protein [Nocardiopsis coralli]